MQNTSTESTPTQNTPIEELIDKTLLATLPDEIEPTMENAWRTFRLLTSNQSVETREKAWFELIESIAPATDQIDFAPEHWQSIITRITCGASRSDLLAPLGRTNLNQPKPL